MSTLSMETDPKHPARIFYDTAAGTPIQGADANYSLVARLPEFIQIEAVASGTTLQVEQRIHASAAWVAVGAVINNATGALTVAFAYPSPNFVRIHRTAGSGDVKAFAQTSE